MKTSSIPNKFFIAFIFFCLGFLTNHFLVKLKGQVSFDTSMDKQGLEERFPVDPADFDQRSMFETIKRMQDEEGGIFENMGELAGVSQREDDKYVYYDIPLKGRDGNNHKLNVEIKNGMIKISEDVKSIGNTAIATSSERMFSIDTNLNADKAEIINEKDKITIKIPKI